MRLISVIWSVCITPRKPLYFAAARPVSVNEAVNGVTSWGILDFRSEEAETEVMLDATRSTAR
jgi:hypothetical protein